MLESLNLFEILGCAVIAVLFVLCLPIARLTGWILNASVWTLRVVLLAVLACGVFFWINPDMLASEFAAIWSTLPSQLQALLPDPTMPVFSLAVACCLTLLCLPLLAVLEVCRRMSGSRMIQLCKLADDSRRTRASDDRETEVRYHKSHVTPSAKGFKLQDSAAAMAGALSNQRKPPRVADYLK